MDGEELGERFGQLTSGARHLSEKVAGIADRLEEHIKDEEDRLKRIEEQLSLGRFLWLTIKAIGLTLVLLITFKVGDISALWRALLK